MATRLTPDQTRATNVNHHLAVEAGAGAGKTTVLVARYLAILESNPALRPHHILTITFTKKAAAELRERIQHAISNRQSDTLDDRIQAVTWQQAFDFSEIGTIASFCGTILRKWGYLIDIDPQFKILDEWESHRIWEQLVDRWLFAALRRHETHLIDALNADPLTKLRETWAAHFRRRGGRTASSNPIVNVLIDEYTKHLRDTQQLDFSMIQSEAVRLLQSVPSVSEKIAMDHPYVMIDEFQDTDPEQWTLIREITKIDTPSPRCNVFVVGDIKQSIYGFRGSDPGLFKQIIDQFNQRSDASVIHLSDNFRSQAPLISFYNTIFSSVFSNNRAFPIQYTPLTANQPTTSHGVELLLSETRDQELADVAAWLSDRHHHGMPWHTCAVLSRNSAILNKLTHQLDQMAIPNRMLSQQNPFHHPDVQHIVLIVCHMLDPNRPEYQIAKSSRLLITYQGNWQHDIAGFGRLAVFDQLFLNNPHWRIVRPFISHLSPPSATISQLQALSTDTSALPSLAFRSESAVTLMTIHAAKGLEFDTVVVIGNGLSHKKRNSDPDPDETDGDNDEVSQSWDEERRIFYVACTRAKTHLLLTGIPPKPKQEPQNEPDSYFDLLLEHATVTETDVTIQFPDQSGTYVIRRIHPTPPAECAPTRPITPDLQPPPLTKTVHGSNGSTASDLPISVSVTDLARWLTCTRQYTLRHGLNGFKGSQDSGHVTRIGTLVHRLLEHRLRQNPLDQKGLDTLCATLGATAIERTAAERQVDAFCHSDYFAQILHNGDCKPELDIVTHLDPFWIKGRMDCLTPRPGSPWIITDFKTGAPPCTIDSTQWHQLTIYAVCVGKRYGLTSDVILNLVYTQSGQVYQRRISHQERIRFTDALRALPQLSFSPPPASTCARCPVLSWVPHCPDVIQH